MYNDGAFQGSAIGYEGEIVVESVKSNGTISDVKVIEGNESKLLDSFETIPKSIIDCNRIKVDTITGTTYTSNGIINATINEDSDDYESKMVTNNYQSEYKNFNTYLLLSIKTGDFNMAKEMNLLVSTKVKELQL